MRGDPLAQSNTSRKFITRLGWIICVLLSFSLLAASARSLFADLYTSLSEQQRALYPASSIALHSAELATRIAPWKAQAWTEYASSATQLGQTDVALAAIAQAIYWAPADAEKWAVMMRTLLAGGRFNQQLKIATSNISRLAPNSPRWRRELAFDGLYLWRDGDDELRGMWLDGIRNSIRYDKDIFLYAVLLARRENDLCEYTGKTLKLKAWCEWVTYWRKACTSDHLTQDQRSYCDAVGFVLDKKP